MQYPTYQWNWTTFFEGDRRLPPARDPNVAQVCRDLPNYTFEQGLMLIVTSVPRFEHQQWRLFCQRMADHADHPHAELWLTVARLMRQGLEDIWQVLSYDIEQGIAIIRRGLADKDDIERFAWMAGLHHYAQTNVQARMMFDYLIRSFSPGEPQLAAMLDFFRDLSERQHDVAVLVAQGYTNAEIAEILSIQPSGVAEHLTAIFRRFEVALDLELDQHARRYRLIHWLTRLFERNPHLLLERP